MMTRIAMLAALLPALGGTARAQPLFYSNPYDAGRGFGLSWHRHRLSAGGFITTVTVSPGGPYGPLLCGPPPPPYGVAVSRVTVVVPVRPAAVVATRPDVDEYDTTGIDLDEIDPVTMKPRPPAPPPRAKLEDLPPAAKPEPKRPEPEPAERQPAPPPPPAPRPKPPPREELTPLERGRRAFAARAYGLAAQHFRLAAAADPKDATPLFLLAQAEFALGKYRQAVDSIRAGVALRPDWPRARFDPREPYRGNDLDFLGHLKRLEDAVERRPDDPDLLFLWAYQLWFDGKGQKALELFRRAKKHARDPALSNRFLDAAVPGPLAAR